MLTIRKNRDAGCMRSSNVTGNGIDPSCTQSTYADVVGNVVPRMKDSTCGTSLDPYTFAMLGVCSLD